MDESRSSVEANRQPLLAGRQTKPETDVCLAGTAVANRDNVLPAGHIFRAGELQYEGLVERGNGREVEAVQALHEHMFSGVPPVAAEIEPRRHLRSAPRPDARSCNQGWSHALWAGFHQFLRQN